MVSKYTKEKKSNEYFIDKIIEESEFIIENLKNIDFMNFIADKMLTNSICFSFIQISENCLRIDEEYRITHYEIPWNEIVGLRNRIVHDYGNVKLEVVFNTAINDLPIFLKTLESLKKDK